MLFLIRHKFSSYVKNCFNEKSSYLTAGRKLLARSEKFLLRKIERTKRMVVFDDAATADSGVLAREFGRCLIKKRRRRCSGGS